MAASPSPADAVAISERDRRISASASRRAVVRAATDELSGRRRLLVEVLFYQPPQSYEEVARRTGMPIGSIGPTRRRTLQDLHHLLRGYDLAHAA